MLGYATKVRHDFAAAGPLRQEFGRKRRFHKLLSELVSKWRAARRNGFWRKNVLETTGLVGGFNKEEDRVWCLRFQGTQGNRRQSIFENGYKLSVKDYANWT